MSTTTREEVIALEQKAVDYAYDCYAVRLAEMSGSSAAMASASGKDSIVLRKAAEARAEAYGGLGSEALVFARVDAPEEPGQEPRPWYIGRRSVLDSERDPVVLLWTSPLVDKWNKALPEKPGDVVLRRRLQCVRRVVEGYFDEIAAAQPAADRPSAAPGALVPAPTRIPKPRPTADDRAEVERPQGSDVADPSAPALESASESVPGKAAEPGSSRTGRRPPAPTPGDVARIRRRKPLQPDELLLRELQRSRSGRMRDIVETIRRDQMELVTGSPTDILVVQGGPGTGKSAVGLHRVTWLVNNEHFTAHDILVVGPHQRFLEYVGQVLPTLGTRDVNAVQLSRLWDADTPDTDTPQARRVKSDERMAAVLRNRVESEFRPEALDDLTTAPAFESDESAVTVTAAGTTLRVPRSEVLDLLTAAQDGGGPYRQRRDRFRTLFVDLLLRELADIAPRRAQSPTIRRDFERNRRVERLVERIWPSPSAREALRSLYASPDLLRSCADGILDEDEQAVLHRPRAAAADAEPWTLDDHVCLEELEFLISGEVPPRYGHIVVDEAQDLTSMQARALCRRCAAGGSMTVLGDLAQATGPHTHTSWERLGTLLSDHGDWRVAELTASYRVPAEIMEFAAPLAHAVAPGLPYPQAVREAGEDAVRIVATEPWKLLEDTVTHVTRLVGSSDDGNNLRSIAVIVPDDSTWLGEITRLLDRNDDVTGPRREAVSVLAAAQAKGMEYDHVLVLEPATIAARGPIGLRQLYIALTRSTQTLTVLHTAPLPEALANTVSSAAPDGIPSSSPAEVRPDDEAAVPEIGSDVRVKVVGPGPSGRYKVTALAPALDRPMMLTVRHGSTPPRTGDKLDCWVFANETNQTVLTTDQRGRLPISPTMAPRYIAALGVLDELVSDTSGEPQDVRARLSELQGMTNRVLRRDQADWVDVRRVLGSPDRQRLSVLRDLVAGTHRALKDGTPDIAALRDRLTGTGWADALLEARDTLRARMDAATPTAPEEAPSTAPAPERQPEQKEIEPVPTPGTAAAAPVTASETVERSALLQALEAWATGDRTCKKHEAVRYALKSALLWEDLEPVDSPVVDVSCDTDQGLRLYEVLGAGRSAYQDLREGATRLLEIDHTLPTSATGLYLVLCEPPAEDWAADAIRDIFTVHVLWRTPDGWGGEEAGAALAG
ncbi:ATP-dependent DNA helicase [Streptomyces sp. NPDC052051]|uniref:ATP-dependent DNA helicase n=1 Tax=Streptomyces sp. NPDC052051 TaxID=3154649 RepID=UPI003431B079